MYNIIAIIICFILPLIVLRKGICRAIKEKQTIKQYIQNNKYNLAIYIIFVIGFFTRLVGLAEYPAGFNQDEASAGYDAYSVLNYGIDRNNQFVPIYFIAWGSGQSVLYSYLMLPFIHLFGLNELTVRLPMAIVGCITLIFVYKLLKQYDKKLTIIGLAFFAICPWHIMKCRWGLDCNLFPDMVLIALCIMIIALKNNQMKKFYIGIAVLSLSVYAYATSYMFLPIFMTILFIYLLATKKIKIRNAIVSLVIALLIVWPMILHVVINVFDLNEIKLGFITIPKLYQNRYEETITIFSSELIEVSLNNFEYNMKFLINQNDYTNYNVIPFYGICYVFSLPFTILGIFRCLTKRNLEKTILNIWFIVSLLLVFTCSGGNVNRLNIIMIPIVMYTVIGIYNIMKNNKEAVIPIATLYCIAFLFFANAYMKTQGKNGTSFAQDLEEPIKYVSTLNVDKVYIPQAFIQPYIYTLFYTQTPAQEYINTVEFFAEKVAFESIKSFGKYHFYLPTYMNEENVAYMLPNYLEIDTTGYKVTTFDRYTVLEK